MYNSVLAALEAFALKANEADELTRFICQRGRALLLGTADKSCSKFSHVVQITNVEVLKRLHLLPVHLPSFVFFLSL